MYRSEAFKILDISESATEEEIKKAYRRAATKWHPDKHTGASASKKNEVEENFKKAKEAYELLAEGKREETSFNSAEEIIKAWWNQTHSAAYGTGKRGNRPKIDPIDDYGNGNWGSSGPGANNHKSTRILNVQIGVTLEEAFRGVIKSIDIPDPNKISGSPLQVEIPPGLSPGERFKVIESGNAQLYLSINIVTDYKCQFAGPFQVNGAGNIIKEYKVDPFTMITGGYIEFTTIDGSNVSVRIPEGLEANMALKLQGKGYWSSTKHKTRGDCFLKLVPDIKKLKDYPAIKLVDFAKKLNDILERETKEST